MERQIVCTVTTSERDEIENLFERKQSLHSLSITLAANNEIFEERSYLAEKILADLIVTEKSFNQWWNDIAAKYELDSSKLEQYLIDFEDRFIYQMPA